MKNSVLHCITLDCTESVYAYHYREAVSVNFKQDSMQQLTVENVDLVEYIQHCRNFLRRVAIDSDNSARVKEALADTLKELNDRKHHFTDSESATV